MNVSTYFKINFLAIFNDKLSIIKIYNWIINSYVFLYNVTNNKVRVELVSFIIFFYCYKIDELAANVVFVEDAVKIFQKIQMFYSFKYL